jgi:polysaccharide export outer membrane protein
MNFRPLIAVMALAISILTFGAVTAQAAPAKAMPSADQTYLLGTSDVIEVSVLEHPDFTTRGRIGDDGAVRLPYLGSVVAANKTAPELADNVAQALDKGGFFTHPIVKVEIVSFGSRYVTVLGEVGTPGIVPVDRAYRLSEILARVGGVKDTGADYVVLRPADGPEQRLAIADIATGGLKEDPYVSPGDKIYSPKADLFYVSGQVNGPGAFALLPDMTIRMAIARAGGVNLQGSEKRLKLTRHGVKVDHVDLNDKIQPGDVLVVGESLF